MLAGCVLEGADKFPALTSIAQQHTVAIASGDIVRIVTPFSAPRVVTTSQADIKRSQNVLYVLTEDDAPISMFVTDGEGERDALSLVLNPQKNGKREVSFGSLVATAPERSAENVQ